jgi:hypothetical protein
MTLYEELYFDIKLSGQKTELKKFISFLRSDGLEDFFEFSSEYITYDDRFNDVAPEEETFVIISNDDYGIEIDEFDTDEFLEVLCRAARALDVEGQVYDADDEEYSFRSDAGNSYYVNAKFVAKFNEDEDRDEEDEEEEES